ncbi:hypothetical protein NP493_22g05053 [Ridgeia piscesae]|uniref:Small vasohibin-binding protein n=1 Tax=Ridgeia piscesae TaxID=27915 RepID=A0AAD9UKP6_RIDPI|nr:hypothetical protein NP493_22g05053 [Ridgeia piscesae]
MSVLTTKNRHNGMSPPRKSMIQQCGESKPKVTKVFWSEAQTLNQNQLGMTFPGAPPCTPTPEVARHYEYVASMTDIRAQRALRAHLDAIDVIQKRKAERDKEMKRKREKTYQKTLQIETKKKQRSQIYALNKLMTEMEHKLFTEFCKQKTETT